MRYMLVALIFCFSLCVPSFCVAQENEDAAETVIEETVGDEAEEGETDEAPLRTEYGVDEPSLMEPYESYDENTGMPNVTESDTLGEIE